MTTERARHPAITPSAIADVIESFYGRVRHDAVLGPIFARHVNDWTPHLSRMNTFWRSVLLGTGEFQRSDRGSPPALHAAVGGLGADDFERWLTLFSATLEERLEPAPAQTWAGRATSIGDSLLRQIRGTPTTGPVRLKTVSS